MKRINFPLCIGAILLSILLILSISPKLFTDIDPTTTSSYKMIKEIRDDGYESTTIVSHPYKPDSENILGTDELGRDIYSRLVHGTRTTLTVAILVVLFRLVLAVPIGLAAGIGFKAASFIIRFFNTIFTAIPLLFVAFFILNIKYVTTLSVEDSTMFFAIVLSILGWGKLGRLIEEKASKIMSEEFIEGEIAVGKSKMQIAVQNMLPHLVPSLISFVFIEVGLVIFLLAQLSILGVFIGPRRVLRSMEGSIRWTMASSPEWSSMLAQMPMYNRIGRYWVGLYPAIAFAVGILAFNLTGEGLRIEFEKRNSRVVSIIRNFGFVFSPKIYFLQLRNFKEYYKPVVIKSLCIVILLTYIFMPAAKSLYPFQVEYAMANLEELMKPEYEGRLSGYDGNYLAGEYIVNKLQEYGLEPYDGENYIQTFPLVRDRGYQALQSAVVIEEAIVNLKNKDGSISTYRLHDDFQIAAYISNDIYIDKLLDKEGYITFHGTSFNRLDEYTAAVKKGIYTNPIYTTSFEYYHSLAENILMFRRDKILSHISFAILDHHSQQVIPTLLHTNHVIVPKGELAEKLKSEKYDVEIKIKPPKSPTNEGRNIFAVLPGKDWHRPNDSQNKKEVIIIGAPYDGIGIDGNNTSAIRSASTAINLEIARVLSQLEEKLEKTIVFAFWDGESIFNIGSNYYNVYDRIFDQVNHKIYYFDIGYVGNGDRIRIDIKSPSLFQIDTYDMTNDIHKRLEKKKVEFVSSSSNSRTFYTIGENLSLKISVHADNFYYIDTDEDTLDNINKKQLENIGQFLIDSITMNEHFK